MQGSLKVGGGLKVLQVNSEGKRLDIWKYVQEQYSINVVIKKTSHRGKRDFTFFLLPKMQYNRSYLISLNINFITIPV